MSAPTTPTPARGRPLGGWPATVAIGALTWKRLTRGKAFWISIGLALLPALMAVIIAGRGNEGGMVDILEVSIILLAVLAPLHVASSLAEEIEERTAAYLWSRPVPRWTILTGKLLALVPMLIVLQIGAALVAGARLGAIDGPVGIERLVLGLGLGTVAAASCAAAFATAYPRHGMGAALVYLVLFDLGFGLIPASLQNLSLSYHMRTIFDPVEPLSATPMIGLVAITAAWLSIAFVRIRRLE